MNVRVKWIATSSLGFELQLQVKPKIKQNHSCLFDVHQYLKIWIYTRTRQYNLNENSTSSFLHES